MRKLIVLIIMVLCPLLNYAQDILQTVLSSKSPKIQKVMENLDKYEVQILLSRINKQGDSIAFSDYEFQLNDNNYFYPASTVKFPVSILAIEKVNEIEGIDLKTPYIIEGDSIEHTLYDDIKFIFAVSSNEAFNRLFEFLGKEYINNRLQEIGAGPAKIEHRLSTENSADTIHKKLRFNPGKSNEVIVSVADSKPIIPLELNGLLKGKGYYQDTLLVESPLDFSQKNYLPLHTIHNIMKRVIYPDKFKAEERFKISEDQRETLMYLMQSLPRHLGFDEKKFHDSYGKFFLFGDSKDPIPRSIKIYNKVGYAYGTLTDCSYIKDVGLNVEYIISATLYVNEDEVLNDNNYEYEEVGIPFLAQLGREIHEYLTTNR